MENLGLTLTYNETGAQELLAVNRELAATMREMQGALRTNAIASNSVALQLEKQGASTSSADKASKGLMSRLVSVKGAMMGAAGAAAAVVAGLGSIVASTVEAGAQTAKLSQALGISARDMQGMGYAASLVGEDMQTIHDAMQTLGERANDAIVDGPMSDAGQMIARLGLNVRDASGQLKDNQTLWYELSDALAAMPNPTERAASAMTLLGDDGVKLLPILDDGADGLRALSKEAEDLGLVMSDETIAATEETRKQWTQTKGALMGVATQIGAALLPTVNGILEKVREWTTESGGLGETLISLAQRGIGPLEAGMTLVGAGLKVVNPLLKITAPLVEAVGDAAEATADAVDYLVTPIGDLIDAIGGGEESADLMSDAIAKVRLEAEKTTTEVNELGTAVRQLGQPEKFEEILMHAGKFRLLVQDFGFDSETLATAILNRSSSAEEATNLLIKKELELTQKHAAAEQQVDQLTEAWERLRIQRGLYEADPTKWAEVTEAEVLAAGRAMSQAQSDAASYQQQVGDVTKALEAVGKATRESTKSQLEALPVQEMLKEGWNELFVLLGGDAAEAATFEFSLKVQHVSRALDEQREAVESLRGSYSALEGVGTSIMGSISSVFMGEVGTWDDGQSLFDVILFGRGGPEERIKYLGEEIREGWRVQMELWAEGAGELSEDFGHFATMAEPMALAFQDADDAAGRTFSNIAGGFQQMSGIIAASTDDIVESLVAINSGFGDQTKAWTTLGSVGIAAGKAFATSVIEDTQAQAGVLAAFEVAEAAAAYPDPIGMASHGFAAVQYGLVASGAVGGSGASRSASGGGGGGRAGGTGGVSPTTHSPRSPAERRSFEDTRETTILQMQVDGRTIGEVAINGANESRSKFRAGPRIDSRVLGGRGRRL